MKNKVYELIAARHRTRHSIDVPLKSFIIFWYEAVAAIIINHDLVEGDAA